MRRGRGFSYKATAGEPVTDAPTLERIRTLSIPPAWRDVWISANPRGHVQATGRDARGRKQFRYHETWTELRDADKYSRVIGFSRALPRIRRRVARDLRTPGLSQAKVVATVVRLMEMTYLRVGNEEYVRQNGSYGLTTLRDRHAKVRGSTVRLRFRGKTGKEVEAAVTDRRVARIVKQCQELPGQELFAYIDDAGERHTISSQDVNAYLRDAAGDDFTAKDFRTWAGTVLAATALRELREFESVAEAKRNVIDAIDRVAKRLGNTRAVSRRAYVHPAVVASYLEGSLGGYLSRADVETGVVAVLRRRRRINGGSTAAGKTTPPAPSGRPARPR